jgi:hypothetical protein
MQRAMKALRLIPAPGPDDMTHPRRPAAAIGRDLN